MSDKITPESAELKKPPVVADDKLPRSVKAILLILLFAALVMILNETTLSVALPAMMADYAITAATAQWLLTGFMLTLAVVMPTTGWMLERFSTRSVFIFAVAAFLIGTIIAALAPSFPVLLAARVAQALGTAIIMPLLMTVAMTLIPFHKRGTVMGLIAVVMAAGPALGPGLAGLILSFTSWHGIFWFMVPFVALAGVIGAAKLTNIGQQRKAPLDVLSVLLSVVAFGGLVYGLSSIAVILEGGQAAQIALLILIAGVVGLGFFVWRQVVLGRSDRALLDLRPMTVPNFTFSLLVAIHVFFSIGLAGLFSPLMTTALSSLPSELYGHGSAILNTLQQLAGAAGTAIMLTVFSNVSAQTQAAGAPETVAIADGANSAFLATGFLVLVALVLSLFIKRIPSEPANN